MGFLSKIFGNDEQEFNEVKIDREVLDSVIYYSQEAYPREFLALFDGQIKNKTLYITGLIFMPGETCNTGAVFHSEMVPPSLKYWGSVHCHPGPSAQPSDADLATFSKHGVFHMIVCLPYSYETFRAYDKYGDSMEYTVGNYGDLSDSDSDDFFDDDDVLEDDEILKPGLLDEVDEFNDEFNNFKQNNKKSFTISNSDDIYKK